MSSGTTTRRHACVLLGAAALAPAGTGALADPAGPPPAWDRWKAAFLREDGRVVDEQQGGVSHSEGQGYGLLLAQAFGDRAAFGRMEDWARGHLAVRDDALMAWRWRPETGSAEPQTATDGDLFRAWALLRAARQSGWDDAMPLVRRIARDLAALCLVPDPRAPKEPLLSPFARPEGDGSAVLVNPSYYMSRALREVGAAAEVPQLIRAADHGERLLSDIAEEGWLPNWVAVTAQGPVRAEGYFAGFGYDALRVPLYLAWSGRGRHRAVALARRLFRQAAPELSPDHVPTVLEVDGTLRQSSDFAGYAALWEVVRAAGAGAGRPSPRPAIGAAPYYPATLGLLARVAAREGGPWD